MKVAKFPAALGLLAALTGCAGPQVQRSEGVQAYCAKLYADGRLDPLKDKIVMPVSVDEPQPIDILANRARPTGTEQAAIKVLSQVRKECNDYAAKQFGAPPSYRQKSQTEITLALAELYAGEISYGDFARAVLHIGDRDKAARDDIEQSIQQHDRWASMGIYN